MLGSGGDRPGEKLDIADDLDTGGAGAFDDRVGARMGQGNTRREHEGRELTKIDGAKISQGEALGGRDSAALGVIIPDPDPRAARRQGPRRRQPAAAKAEDRHRLASEDRDGDHLRRTLPYLSFKVARPTIASITATIQKRMTTVGSDQPIFSK